jgi:hypothetical protein
MRPFQTYWISGVPIVPSVPEVPRSSNPKAAHFETSTGLRLEPRERLKLLGRVFSLGEKFFRLHRKKHTEKNIFLAFGQRAKISHGFVPIAGIRHLT